MNIKVLIADDQALIRSGLRAIIESEPGLEVVGEAGDGAEAVEAVRRLRPDVALMDIRMPRLDGVAATRTLLRGAAPVPTKILILTTFHLDAYVTEALRAGASGFLLKEATADQLIEAVRVIASGEAILTPSVTRRLLERMAADPAAAGDGARGRRAAAGRPRTVKRRDRREAPLGRDHGKKPRAEHAGQARRARSPSGRGRRLRFGAGAAARVLTIVGPLAGRPGYGQGLTRVRRPGAERDGETSANRYAQGKGEKVMGLIDEALRANATIARDYDPSRGKPPAPKIAIVTCADPRLTSIEQMLGLAGADVDMIRNFGTVIDDDAVRSLVLSTRLLGTTEIMIINHTDCGMLRFTDNELEDRLRKETGRAPIAPAKFYSFTDAEANTKEQIQKARSHPWISSAVPVRGFVYDVETGRLSEVFPDGETVAG
jgi:carbonic anhydrase